MKTERSNRFTGHQPSISSIEADLAFFDARIALVSHQSDTGYKRAQLHIYTLMKQELMTELEQLRAEKMLDHPC